MVESGYPEKDPVLDRHIVLRACVELTADLQTPLAVGPAANRPHVAAIQMYRFALGRNLLGPMITGKAELAPGVEPMRPGKWWVALLCLAAGIAITRWIIAGAPL